MIIVAVVGQLKITPRMLGHLLSEIVSAWFSNPGLRKTMKWSLFSLKKSVRSGFGIYPCLSRKLWVMPPLCFGTTMLISFRSHVCRSWL